MNIIFCFTIFIIIIISTVSGNNFVDWGKIDPKKFVTIKAKSTGCFDEIESSIIINEKTHILNGPINVIIIDPNGYIKYHFLDNSSFRFSSRIKLLRYYNRTVAPGTVFILVTRNLCQLTYRRWYQKYKIMAGILVGKKDNYKADLQTGVIFGCREYCPPFLIQGKMPSNYFNDSDVIVKELKFGFKGYIEEEKETNKKEKNNSPETDDTNTTIIIILVIIILILISIITIIILCVRHKNLRERYSTIICGKIKHNRKESAKENSECLQQEIYQDLRRPSAMPNLYEPLQKMSVQYEEIKEVDCEDGENNDRKLRADTNLSQISATSLGTSQNIFRKISTESMKDKGNFASYVQVDETKVIYKSPSSVPKFEAPKTTPQNKHRDSYIAMEINEYEAINNTQDNQENEYTFLYKEPDSELEGNQYCSLNT